MTQDTYHRRIMMISITLDRLMRYWTPGDLFSAPHRIVEGVPKGSTILSAWISTHLHYTEGAPLALYMIIEHESFAEIPEGHPAPVLKITHSTEGVITELKRTSLESQESKDT